VIRAVTLVIALVAALAAPAAASVDGTAGSGAPARGAIKADKVLVLKGQREMLLLREGKVFRTYKVALGIKPRGHKEQRGDNRTPEGQYILGGRNPESRFYKSIHISYPNEADRAAARARGVNPGGSIMIHGVPPDLADLGADHRLWDWTNGCIAVTNREMDEIWNLVEAGTPIEIRP